MKQPVNDIFRPNIIKPVCSTADFENKPVKTVAKIVAWYTFNPRYHPIADVGLTAVLTITHQSGTIQAMKTLLSIVIIVAMLAGCSPPPPDDVLRVFLDHVNDKNYDRALSFAGPKLLAAYSNNLWLTDVHQMYVGEQEYVVEPPDHLTLTSAQLRAGVTFHMKRSRETIPYYFLVDMSLKDKWYISDVWYIDDHGGHNINVLDSLPSSPFGF